MTKETATPNACPFCKIISCDDEEAREVYRDSQTVTFFPTDPAILGHTLIVPRRHASNIWDLPIEDAAQIARVSVLIAHAIQSTIQPDGLSVIQSNGSAASQTVMHYHTHLVPRWKGDAIGKIWPPDSNYPEWKKDEAWAKLRKDISLRLRPTAE